MEWTDISITVAKRDADTAEGYRHHGSQRQAFILRITATWNSRRGRSPM